LVSALNLVAILVGKGQFENLAREVGFGCAPGPCAGPEAMYGDAMAGGVLAFSGGQICAQLAVALRAGRIGTRARSPGPGEGRDVRHYALAGFLLHANML